jgi:hypothetical protein
MTTLTELRKLAEAATPGPWREGTPPPNGTTTVGTVQGLMTAHCFNGRDSAFISAANPATILALLDLIAQCKEALSVANTNMYFKAAVDALAAIAKFEGGK